MTSRRQASTRIIVSIPTLITPTPADRVGAGRWNCEYQTTVRTCYDVPRLAKWEISIRHFALISAVILSLAMLIALSLLVKPMDPVTRGNSTHFWKAACGVDLGGASNTFIGAALIQDGRAWYSLFGYHGPIVFWIPEAEAMKSYPRVLAELEALTPPPEEDDPRVPAYARWKSYDAAHQQGASGLLEAIEDARTERVIKRLANERPGLSRWDYDERRYLSMFIERRQAYAGNFIFELLFFVGLIWFTLWPIIHEKSVLRRLLHIMAAPTLLMTPAWLGYCAFCHPNILPAGGILYPWILHFSRNFQFNYGWDMPYQILPPALWGINQMPVWTYQEFIQSRVTLPFPPGPIQTLLAGFALCALYLLAHYVARQLREARLRRPGFEILPPTPSNTTPEFAPPDSAHP